MFEFIASTFGYVLNFIYELVKNYGLAILIFSILMKVVLLPISLKQQKTMKKTAKIQEKLKELQFKYKNNPEMLNKETMALYKSENMSPFSGCLSSIIQILLLLSVFYMVSSPLTYVRKVDPEKIENYKTQISEEATDKGNIRYQEIKIIQEYGEKDETVYLNMNFLGLDLSLVPLTSLTNYTVLILPALYVLTSIISMRISTNIKKKKKKEEKSELIEVDKEGKVKETEAEIDPMEQATKNMSYIMPVMCVSVALIAPLGLALYWTTNNILMIIERIIINKFMDKNDNKKEA